jgi:alpha-beta hydrolase superfamily lysophospholipase
MVVLDATSADRTNRHGPLRRWLGRLLWSFGLIFGTLVIGGAVGANRRLPDLEVWHRLVPRDVRAADLDSTSTLADYLRREDAAFKEVEQRVEQGLDRRLAVPANRYNTEGISSPRRLGVDWNRTQELVPAGELAGGVVLLHGLTDAPYSMRAVGEMLREYGYYGLALRMPGHGTVPGGLTSVTWEDWMAAVRLGARHVRGRIGPDKPLIIVGYSNGGALAVKYVLDVLDGSGDPQATRVVLLSPMIGVAPYAWLTRVISLLGPMPGFEKARWLDVYPEYNPFKYTSFPANAGLQTWRLTRALQSQVADASSEGRLGALPPMLTFQSLVDATVSTPAVVHSLYDQLAANGSEIVMFDINRLSGLTPFIRASDQTLLSRLTDALPRRYRRTLVTNGDVASRDVIEKSVPADSVTRASRPLGIAWPADVFSLSHIAIPFPTDDPVYGRDPATPSSAIIRIGQISPRGERAVLTVPADTLTRVTCNPFFPYMSARIGDWVTSTSK